MRNTILVLLVMILALWQGQARDPTAEERVRTIWPGDSLIAHAASDPAAAEALVEATLAASDRELSRDSLPSHERSLLLHAGDDVLAGAFGNLSAAAMNSIAGALVSIAVRSDPWSAVRAGEILRDAGQNGFAGAAEALYRVYQGRREAGHLDGMSMIPRYLADLPGGRGLPYLARITTQNNDEFGEADIHNGLVGRLNSDLVSALVANKLAMLHMSESPEGRALLLELEEEGRLNKLVLRKIRYDEGGLVDEICENVPELSVCIEKAELGFDRGHQTIDGCAGSSDLEACREWYLSEITPCFEMVSENGFWTEASLACRDDVLKRWHKGLIPGS